MNLFAIIAAASAVLLAQISAVPGSWLDRPLAGWNTSGAALPTASVEKAKRDALVTTCGMALPQPTPAERALANAGWIPFRMFDRQLVRDDVEVVGGMAGADGMCQPLGYNIVVFVGGRVAGTLSPSLMNAREDGASGAVRILDASSLSAEFVRYADKDALCCPSSRVTVRYRIDRSGPQPVVMPVERRVTRGL